MRKPIGLLICAAYLSIASAAQAADWSGYYLATTTNSSYITLELLETKTSHLVGRYKQIVVDENGPRLQQDFPVTGAVRGNQFVGRIERSWIYGGDLAVSGQRTASGVQLSGSGGLEGHFTMSSPQNERATIAALAFRAKQLALVKQEKREKEALDKRIAAELAEIERALDEVKEFQLRWPQTVAALSKVAVEYETTNAQQESMFERAKGLDDIQRFQVSIDMEQLSIASLFQTNIRVEQSEWASRQALENVQRRLSSAIAVCEAGGFAGRPEAQYLAKCSLLNSAPDQIRRLSLELDSTFKNLRLAYQEADQRGRRLMEAVHTGN